MIRSGGLSERRGCSSRVSLRSLGPASGAEGGSLLEAVHVLYQPKDYESDDDKVKCGLKEDPVIDDENSRRPWLG